MGNKVKQIQNSFHTRNNSSRVDLLSLQKRKFRSMIKICKIMSTIERVDRHLFMYFFQYKIHQMVPLYYHLGVENFKTNKKKWFFMQQVLWPWSSLPKDALFAKHLYGLADRLNDHLENKSESSWRQTEYYGWNIIHACSVFFFLICPQVDNSGDITGLGGLSKQYGWFYMWWKLSQKICRRSTYLQWCCHQRMWVS